MIKKISENINKTLTNLKIKKIFRKINWEIFQNNLKKKNRRISAQKREKVLLTKTIFRHPLLCQDVCVCAHVCVRHFHFTLLCFAKLGSVAAVLKIYTIIQNLN